MMRRLGFAFIEWEHRSRWHWLWAGPLAAVLLYAGLRGAFG